MSRKPWLFLAALIGALALLSLPAGAASPPALAPTPISAPPEWVNFYGLNSTLNGAPLPAGAEVVAYAGSKRCGSFVVHTAGQYGLLPCFREQSGQPGAQPGDTIRFTINGIDALTRGPDEPIWTNQGDRKNVELEAAGAPGGPTATRTVLSTATRTATVLAPASPTPIPTTPAASPTSAPTGAPFPTPSATVLLPPLPTPTTALPQMPMPAGACYELIQDGGFEAGVAWTSDNSARPATRSTSQVHSGFYAMRLGIDSDTNVNSNSAVRQRIQIPHDATTAMLTFYYYPASDPTPGSNYWQVQLMDAGTNNPVATLWQNAAGNERRWLSMSFDVIAHRGRTLDLYFNMHNSGSGGRSALYLDDVSLQVCISAPPTWTPPTATPRVATATPYIPPTPWPTAAGNCQEVIANGGFEAGAQNWTLGATKAAPGIVNDPRHSGNAAIRLGIVNGVSINAFSSIRQTVTIPSDAVSADLTYWVYMMSLETVAAGKDHQELVYLSPVDSSTMALPWRTFHENTRAWTQKRQDLLAYRGQSLALYFNVYNDGINGDSAMIVDDVSLRICRNIPPTAIPLAISPTPFAPPTANAQAQAPAVPTTAMALARPTPTATPTPAPAEKNNTLLFAIPAVLVASLIMAAVIIFRRQLGAGKDNTPQGGGDAGGTGGQTTTGGTGAGTTPAGNKSSTTGPESLNFKPKPGVRIEQSGAQGNLGQDDASGAGRNYTQRLP